MPSIDVPAISAARGDRTPAVNSGLDSGTPGASGASRRRRINWSLEVRRKRRLIWFVRSPILFSLFWSIMDIKWSEYRWMMVQLNIAATYSAGIYAAYRWEMRRRRRR